MIPALRPGQMYGSQAPFAKLCWWQLLCRQQMFDHIKTHVTADMNRHPSSADIGWSSTNARQWMQGARVSTRIVRHEPSQWLNRSGTHAAQNVAKTGRLAAQHQRGEHQLCASQRRLT